MRRYAPYAVPGAALLVLALVFLRQQNQPTSSPPSGGDQAVVGLAIPERSCTYFRVPGPEFPARVVQIRDADDIVIRCHDASGNSRVVVVRLAEIDSPEFGQPYHTEAKAFLSALTLGQEVVVKYREINDFRGRGGICRIVGWVRLAAGGDVSRLLLARGLAWHYEDYSDHLEELRAIEQEARQAKRGLWVDHWPISPWDWRRGVRR
jgi:endonuclease YncB( thermonuclease family)